MSTASNESLATVLVKPGEADRILSGHPWVYEGSILRVTRAVADGEVVQVKDHRQRFLGIGFFNSKSRIRVRMLARERVAVDPAFFEHRIRQALAVRKRHFGGATSYRLVNAESDGLSGLIVDCYEDVLVVQMSSLGMDRRKAMVVDALRRVMKPRAILERNDMGSRKFEGLELVSGVLSGTLDPGEMAAFPVRLNGLTFTVNLSEGHKTGLYLDQQANYERTSRWAKGGAVLDCFSFLGGFALHAARAGAKSVLGLDQSAEAVAAAGRHAAANGVGDRCRFEEANVFDWLKTATAPSKGAAGEGTPVPATGRFDLIVLDPPSFTRTRSAVPDALRGYKEIHLRALKLLAPGGVLATFCCSHHVDGVLFEQVIMDAAFDARARLRRIETFSQSPDHPVLPAVPETQYLKGYAYEVVED